MAPRIKYCCNNKSYEDYYLNQAGNGIAGFQGTRYQRGAGLGSMFSGLIRLAAPLLRKGGVALGKFLVDKAADHLVSYSRKRPAKRTVRRSSKKRKDIFK